MLSGGLGRDLFVFSDISDSYLGLLDSITDFSRAEGDRISLGAIDADESRARNQAFQFIGQNEFTGKAGELRYYHDQGKTYVTGDVNGDGSGDFLIMLQGMHSLTSTDFIL